MNNKDIFELFQSGFTARNTFDSYSCLRHFLGAMRCGRYYPITDEEIHIGVEYKKAEGKALLKAIGSIIPDKDKELAEAMVETFCNQSLQQFLGYKHAFDSQNNQR